MVDGKVRVAMALQLQAAFGLRAKEAYMLRPHLADQGSILAISRGAKNGRPRTVRIETEFQRKTLDQAKALVGGATESIGDPHLTPIQIRIAAFDRQKLFMSARLDDLAMLERNDAIALADRRQPMRDNQHSAAGGHRL